MTSQPAAWDDRSEPRQDVMHRTRGLAADGRRCAMTLVNISPRGFMARTERDHAPGDRVRIDLPGLGLREAEVRWALGGRIGCRLQAIVGLEDYQQLLKLLARGG